MFIHICGCRTVPRYSVFRLIEWADCEIQRQTNDLNCVMEENSNQWGESIMTSGLKLWSLLWHSTEQEPFDSSSDWKSILFSNARSPQSGNRILNSDSKTQGSPDIMYTYSSLFCRYKYSCCHHYTYYPSVIHKCVCRIVERQIPSTLSTFKQRLHYIESNLWVIWCWSWR